MTLARISTYCLLTVFHATWLVWMLWTSTLCFPFTTIRRTAGYRGFAPLSASSIGGSYCLGTTPSPLSLRFLTEVLVLLQAGLRGFILPRDLAPLSGMISCLARVGGRGPLAVGWFVPSSPKCVLDFLPCLAGCHPLPCRLWRLAFPGLIDCAPGPAAGSARLISRVLCVLLGSRPEPA